jgi:hypothetical protein
LKQAVGKSAFAALHTHRNANGGQPSQQDIDDAKKLGKPNVRRGPTIGRASGQSVRRNELDEREEKEMIKTSTVLFDYNDGCTATFEYECSCGEMHSGNMNKFLVY